MEILSASWLASLAAIVVIDLLIAGDNAVVISLASRGVSQPLRRRARIVGVAGAIAVRAAMVAVVAWLLAVPGFRLAGGIALLWIGYKLLVPGEIGKIGVGYGPLAQSTERPALRGDGQECVPDPDFPDTHFTDIAALRAILLAAMVMGTTNVIAIFGAADGHWPLMAIGFLLSLPIVAWGAPWAQRVMERFPFALYVAVAVLAWTAVNLVAGEPLVGERLAAMKPHRVALLYVLVVGGVLFSGLARTQPRFRDYGLPAGIGTVLAIFIMTLMG